LQKKTPLARGNFYKSNFTAIFFCKNILALFQRKKKLKIPPFGGNTPFVEKKISPWGNTPFVGEKDLP
jgi:hypothetical protein